MINTEFKTVSGTRGLYKVDRTGNVWRCRAGKPQYTLSAPRGYVNLCHEGKREKVRVDVLVARAFVPNPMRRPYLWHKDYDRMNNNADNLEWRETEQQWIRRWQYGRGHHRSRLRGVVQYNKAGELMNRFVSVTEAEEKTGVRRSTIRNSAEGRSHIGGGYIWRYE